MQAPTTLLLDEHGDALLPPGYTVIQTELDWLRYTISASPLQPPLVVVRGRIITHWARKWWEVQGGTCRELVSPGERIRRVLPMLTVLDAQELAAVIHASWPVIEWPNVLSLPQLLTALYPAAQTLWELVPEPEHFPTAVAKLLEWLRATPSLPPVQLPLLQAWLSNWQIAIRAAAQLPDSVTGATALLRAWAGMPDEEPTTDYSLILATLDECLLPLPLEWRVEARQGWDASLHQQVAGRLPGTEPGLALAAWWSQVRSNVRHPDLRPIALQTVLRYLDDNPATLSDDVLRAMCPDLPAAEYRRLQLLLPPPDPTSLPTDPEAVLRWVTDEYLPFRAWQTQQPDRPEALVTVRAHALAFGDWLLANYPTRLTGATIPYQQLYWSQPARLQPQPHEVVVWVIADGLGWEDAKSVARQVHELSAGELSATHATPCFGLLPTITPFTKIAVRAGLPFPQLAPHRAQVDADMETDVRDNQDPVDRASHLRGGELLVWRPMQPDKAYHTIGETAVVLRQARAALRYLAETLVDLAHKVPRSVSLRIQLTTDHGRMMGSGLRTIEVPEDFVAEGRAAYREQAGPPPAPSPDITWLDPATWFNLTGWVGVVREENCFRIRRPDGSQAGGIANFSHGGIWPEEVVVPWFTIARDVMPVRIVGTASGRARVGSTGRITLRIVHQGDQPVRARCLNIAGATGTLRESYLDMLIPGHQTITHEAIMADWPTGLQLHAAKLTIMVQLADGQEMTFTLTNELSADEFQTQRTDLLSDL
ncbi:hypothetical protein [Fibrella aquatica]|uniref:hypothetical protein n=1 Tax=Fibrella aquatica TaxID=3242487 RepID=UPI00351FE5E0